ncbi:metallophosphoesterase family protein [Actinoplanes sp. NPDC049681]|uniref:metallophosphoesterase family protein n=1 Tax=Actinoplanes sp. NPDC049681 TaxID=3363905 RepID=UPI0037BBB5E2
MSAPGPAGLVIAHLSDLHLGAHDPDTVESVVADVAAVRPALTVVTGDCTMRARNRQFRQARHLIDRLPAPRLVVLGNHDVPLISVRRLVSPYRRYQVLIEPDLEPVVRLPGLTALGLATAPAWRWKSGRVSRRQSDAVVAVLAAAPLGDVRLLAVHHPPRATGLARVAGRGRLLSALAVARADLVLAGHTHVPASGTVRTAGTSHRLIEVVAGTATSRRTRGVGRSWTVIRIDEEAVHVEERHQSGAGWRTGPVHHWPRRT